MTENLLVAKYGTTSVTNGEGIDHNQLDAYSENMAEIAQDYNLIVVSSGAMLTGRHMLEQLKGAGAEASDETLSTIGSPDVVTAWKRALLPHGLLAGQVLVTHRELEDPKESEKLETSLSDSLEADVVPVINENDALSDKELAKIAYGGDNDGLASHVARRMGAQVLCIFSDVDGLLSDSELVPSVPALPKAQAKAMRAATDARYQKSERPSGMPYKVDAAIKAANDGIATYIANANADIGDILEGNAGTYFEPKQP